MNTLTFELNTTSYYLASLLAAGLALLYYTSSPPSLIHPFLLGRQVLASQTRNENESPVYCSSVGGGMRAAQRPEKGIRLVGDILKQTESRLEGVRGSWSKGGEKVSELVPAIRAGLLAHFGNSNGSIAVVVSDPTDALLVTLALISTSWSPIIIVPGSAIPSNLTFSAIVHSNDLSPDNIARLAAAKDVKQLILEKKGSLAEEILAEGKMLLKEQVALESAELAPTVTAVTFISGGAVLDFTHLNLTAALVSWLSIFPGAPYNTRPSSKDVAISFHHPSTPYGFGLSLALLYASASINLPAPPTSTEALDALLNASSSPPPSLLFGPESVIVSSLHSQLLSKMLGDASFIIKRSRTGKLALLRKGVLSRETFWDKLLFNGVRKDAGLTSIRAIIIAGTVEQSKLDLFRLILGSPAVSTLEHNYGLAPLTATMMWDVQRLPPPFKSELDGREKGHVGAPTAGTEIKFQIVESEIARGRIRGELLFRSPALSSTTCFSESELSVSSPLPLLPPSPGSPAKDSNQVIWLRSGLTGELSTEGTLWI